MVLSKPRSQHCHCIPVMAGGARSKGALELHLRSADGALTALQAILFVDDKTVSKGMVKYATNLPRESIVDVSGEVHVPDAPVAGCTCSKVRLLPFTVLPLLTSHPACQIQCESSLQAYGGTLAPCPVLYSL